MITSETVEGSLAELKYITVIDTEVKPELRKLLKHLKGTYLLGMLSNAASILGFVKNLYIQSTINLKLHKLNFNMKGVLVLAFSLNA